MVNKPVEFTFLENVSITIETEFSNRTYSFIFLVHSVALNVFNPPLFHSFHFIVNLTDVLPFLLDLHLHPCWYWWSDTQWGPNQLQSLHF
jgi:hypothetical protein